MALETVNYQCPSCGGPLNFSGETGKLVCGFCDSSYTPEQVEQFYAEKQAKAEAKAQKEEERQGKHAAPAPGADGERSNSIFQALKFCPTCGDPIEEGERFCGVCGTSIEDAQAEADEIVRKAAKRKAKEGGSASEVAAAAAAVGGIGAAAAASAQSDVRGQKVEKGSDPVQEYLKRTAWQDEDSDHMRSYTCSSCGAELMVHETSAVATCPYCGNNSVLPGTLGGMLKPDFIIPFSTTKEEALAALSEHYKGKRLLPSVFKNQNHLEEIQGVYVPFWLYSAKPSGSARYDTTNVRTWTDGDYNYTETSYYECDRVATMEFERVPADGSTRMPDAHMDAIEPYNYGKMVPFNVAFLPGYVTERYDVSADESSARASKRIEKSAVDAMTSTVTGYSTVSISSSHVDVNYQEIAYALLPVWMLHTKWNDKDFLFAMNGQTGKLIGDLPVDKGKQTAYFMLTFAIVAIIVFLIVWFGIM